jgi:hypothetical protein
MHIIPGQWIGFIRHTVTSHAPRWKAHSSEFEGADFSRASEKQSAVPLCVTSKFLLCFRFHCVAKIKRSWCRATGVMIKTRQTLQVHRWMYLVILNQMASTNHLLEKFIYDLSLYLSRSKIWSGKWTNYYYNVLSPSHYASRFDMCD